MKNILRKIAIIWLGIGIIVSSITFAEEFKSSNKSKFKGGYNKGGSTNRISYTDKDYSNTFISLGATLGGFLILFCCRYDR